MSPSDKHCATCGRSFSWRKKWENNWEEVRYCSSACRRNKPGEKERQIEARVLEMVASRTGSVCPSEVARSINDEDWRQLMEPVRQAARRLQNDGRLQITQDRRPVGTDFRGPIRLEPPR